MLVRMKEEVDKILDYKEADTGKEYFGENEDGNIR
jgi:hypothetical protein